MKTTVAYCHGKKSTVHHQSDSIRKTNEKKGGEGGQILSYGFAT
jgi:hypothetical protein